MSLLTEIKTKQLQARKDRDPLSSSILTTLIGEAEMVGKNHNRQSTDDEVRAVIKKFIKNNDEVIKVTSAKIHLETNAQKNKTVHSENLILRGLLPPQLTGEQLREIIGKLILAAKQPNVGIILKGLKEALGNSYDYDGAEASLIAKELLSN